MSTKITGVGKYVAIAASNSAFPYVPDESVNGVSFGTGSIAHASVSTRYTLAGSEISGTALCVDNQHGDYMFLNFDGLQQLVINGKTGYSGSLRVATSTAESPDLTRTITYYATPVFLHGLLRTVQ